VPTEVFLATAVVLSPVYTAVTWQRVCMLQYDICVRVADVRSVYRGTCSWDRSSEAVRGRSYQRRTTLYRNGTERAVFVR
jgi:hypothetical protein